MTGLTAKVFRTYNASFTMATLLKDMKSEGTMMERVKDYNDANRKVAILCNHKRSIGAAHATQMEKMTDKVRITTSSADNPPVTDSATRSTDSDIRNGESSR
jgi:DNA topoisomerase-1